MDLVTKLSAMVMAAGVTLSTGIATGAVEAVSSTPAPDGVGVVVTQLWQYNPVLAAIVLTTGGFLLFLWRIFKVHTAAETAREQRTHERFEKLHDSSNAVHRDVAAALNTQSVAIAKALEKIGCG